MPEIPFNFLSLLYCTVCLCSKQKWKTQILRLLTQNGARWNFTIQLMLGYDFNATTVSVRMSPETEIATPPPPPHLRKKRANSKEEVEFVTLFHTRQDAHRPVKRPRPGNLSQEASSPWPATPRCLLLQVQYASHPQWSGHWLWDPLHVPTPTNSAMTPMPRLHRWPCMSFPQHQRTLQPCILRLLLFSFFLSWWGMTHCSMMFWLHAQYWNMDTQRLQQLLQWPVLRWPWRWHLDSCI